MLTVQQKLGKRVRALRLARGWTQEQLGQRAEKHWTYIGGIERGTRNPTVTVVAAIAKALRVSIAELFAAESDTEVGS